MTETEPRADKPAPVCEDCGYETDSFACKVRHVSVNVENLRRGH